MINRLKKKLYSDSYEKPYEAIQEIVELEDISSEIINLIFSLEDTLVISEFLHKVEKITPDKIIVYKKNVLERIFDSDYLLVSDIIDFSNKWGIDVFDICLKMGNDYNNDSNVVLSCINYVFERINYERIGEVFNLFNKIRKDRNYFQNVQITAIFYLFRLSHDKAYLVELENLVKNGQPMNKEILANILKWNYNDRKYFKAHDILVQLCK